ncbi:MAG: InlB B-repeat-containing protein, partial [Clostridia bacterium]|nr:InlB B-repeat-containing protein [Clostridia bacterium]
VFNANGGTGTMANQAFKYGVSQDLTANTFTRTGYTFSGWSLSSSSSTVTYKDKANVKNLTPTANGKFNLYAVWSPITYKLSYTLDGGSVATENPTTYKVTTATFTLNNPTKTGYTFAGWTGTGLSSATTTVTITQGSTGDRSYTATWTPNTNTKYTVNHYVMDTSGNYPSSATKTESKTGTTAASLTLANLKDGDLLVPKGITYSYGQVGGTTVTTTTISADGSRVINLYYARS